ncbi:tyrosine-type recombinase/integrase [Lactococcus lactis]|nr:tyrosine-type recombinase/integrase [Lactococcus lactis]
MGLDHHITSHGLRHTHASVLLYKRVNIMTISKKIGHSNISIILDMYFHILKS